MHELWGSATGTTAEGINSSPAVVGGLAYVGSDDGSLWALDAPTGAPVWHDPVGSVGMWAGAAFAQGTVYVGSGQSKVFAYDAATAASSRLAPSALGFGARHRLGMARSSSEPMPARSSR
jgi:outer membrane protein assembly factor BamB